MKGETKIKIVSYVEATACVEEMGVSSPQLLTSSSELIVHNGKSYDATIKQPILYGGADPASTTMAKASHERVIAFVYTEKKICCVCQNPW